MDFEYLLKILDTAKLGPIVLFLSPEFVEARCTLWREDVICRVSNPGSLVRRSGTLTTAPLVLFLQRHLNVRSLQVISVTDSIFHFRFKSQQHLTKRQK